MGIDDEIVIDNPNLGVSNREIRLTWIKGDVSLISLSIIAQNPKKEIGGPRVEISRNSWIGPSCFEEPMNCIFAENEVNDVKNCPGTFVKIGGKAQNKNIACMSKCIASS